MEKKVGVGVETPPQKTYIQDSEEGVTAFLDKRRGVIKNMLSKEHDPLAKAINVEELDETDITLFNKFDKGMLELEEIEKHQDLLAPLPDVDSSKRFLEYMRRRLAGQR